MNGYLLGGLLAVAAPALAHAQPSLAVSGWGVSSGHSAAGEKTCTLSGDVGDHSSLAWVANAANSPQHVTLFFDDGGAPLRSQVFVSRLMVTLPGSSPLFMSGTVRFGQFRTTLDPRSFKPLLHLFAAKRSMTVALEGDRPVLVNLKGSADAAQDLRHCEGVKTLARRSGAPVRLAAAGRHSDARMRRAAAARSAARMAMEPALPDPPPVAPASPELAPAVATAVLEPPAAAPAALAAHAPAATETLTLDDTNLLARAMEDQFKAILQDGKASYENTNDRDLSFGARATRAADLCILLGNDKEAIDWTGTISDLASSGQGQPVLAVKLADGVTVGTTDGTSSDSKYPAVIDPASGLFKSIAQMHVGEHVTFSGRFFASDADCIKETSLTENGSMTAPRFLMEFTAVAAQN